LEFACSAAEPGADQAQVLASNMSKMYRSALG